MINIKNLNKNDYIAVYDSGIGGLNVLKLLKKYMPYENYLYFGDNSNAPYGNLNNETLIKLSVKNVKNIEQYGIKAIVLACNTLSTVCYEKLIKRFKLKFIQTLPPIKNNFYNEKTYLVCTKNTAKSNFVKKYKKAVKVLPAPQLATKIEKGIFNLNKVNDDIFNFLPKQDISVLILGCTHYCFLLNKFTKALPNVQIVQPEYLSMLALNDFLSENNLKNQSSVDGKIHFIGENAYYNRYVYENFCLKN